MFFLNFFNQDEKWGNSIGLPGTKNIIQKWSVKHLNGIDLTSLGPPVKKDLSTSNISPPFHLPFKLPFSHQIDTDIIPPPLDENETSLKITDSDHKSDLIPDLAEKFEKLLQESSNSNEEIVEQLADNFKKMVEESIIEDPETETDPSDIDADIDMNSNLDRDIERNSLIR